MYRSPLALRPQRLSRAYRAGKLREMYYAPAAIVIHTTGDGPIRRAEDDRFEPWRARWDIPTGDALRAAVVLYTRIMDPCAHYVVGQDGSIVQLVPEDRAAWHVGGKGSRPYWTDPDHCLDGPRFAWWRDRWPKLKTPRDLARGKLWREAHQPAGIVHQIRSGFPLGSCNENTIGIEVVGPGPWSSAAHHALAALCIDISQRRQLPLRRDTVITHSDAHPLSRTTARGAAWDPSPSAWTWERFAPLLDEIRAPQVRA